MVAFGENGNIQSDSVFKIIGTGNIYDENSIFGTKCTLPFNKFTDLSEIQNITISSNQSKTILIPFYSTSGSVFSKLNLSLASTPSVFSYKVSIFRMYLGFLVCGEIIDATQNFDNGRKLLTLDLGNKCYTPKGTVFFAIEIKTPLVPLRYLAITVCLDWIQT